MGNSIRYTTSGLEQPKSLSRFGGQMFLGTGDVQKGPSNITGFYNETTPPSGGYTIYMFKASSTTGGLSYHVCQNDSQLISFTNQFGNSFGDAASCLEWYMTQSDKMVLDFQHEPISADGLRLNLDASFCSSYPRTGSNWYNFSEWRIDATYWSTLYNSPDFSTNAWGYNVFNFGGTNEYSDLVVSGLNPNFSQYFPITFEMWMKVPTATMDGFYMILQLDGSMGILCQNGEIGFANNAGTWLSGFDMIKVSSGVVDSLGLKDNWAHYTFVINYADPTYTGPLNQNHKIYINGQLQVSGDGSAPDAGNIQSNNEVYGNIAYWNTNSYYASVSVGSCRIYNRELSTAEVLKNYNVQKGRYGL